MIKKITTIGLVTLLAVLCVFGSIASADSSDNNGKDRPTAIVIMNGKSFTLPENASGKSLGRADGPIKVIIRGQAGEDPVDVCIEASEDGVLTATVRKAIRDSEADEVKSITVKPKISNGNIEKDVSAATAPNRYGWAKSWIECPAGIHNCRVEANMKYYDNGSTVGSGQDGKCKASTSYFMWNIENGPWGYWNPNGPSMVWINSHAEFDSPAPGDQHHTQMCQFHGFAGGTSSSIHSIDQVPGLHTFHGSHDVNNL